MTQFNGLTEAEHERLALLAEELSEAVSMIGKILRHGYESFNPDDEEAGDNKMQLAHEIGDISYALRLMLHSGDIEETEVAGAAYSAANKKPQYLHHQPHGLLKWAGEHFKGESLR